MGLPVAGLVARACARASGMYMSGGLLACGWLTRPMTVNLVPPMVVAEPSLMSWDAA